DSADDQPPAAAVGVDLGGLPGVDFSGRPTPPVVPPKTGSGLTLQPCSLNEKCPEDNVCYPHQQDPKKGVCAKPPTGGVVIPDDAGDFPVPVAYFPLTGQSLNSWPDEQYVGASNTATFRQDSQFGSVLHCKENTEDLVVIQNVEYGRNGSFSISFWMKKDISASSFGDTHQFIYSHTTVSNTNNRNADPTSTNQIQVYLPEISHPAHGLLRVLIKDDNDTPEAFYMDSDGSIANNDERNVTNHVEIEDGNWHMFTVTTQPSGGKGYRIYIDGELAASTPDSKGVNGGDPIELDGNIYLCGRVDNARERHFDGAIAKLSIFDVALEEEQVQSLYAAVWKGTTDGIQDTKTANGGLLYARGTEVQRSLNTTTALAAGADYSAPPRFDAQEFASKTDFCNVAPSALGADEADCEVPEICAPLHIRQLKMLVRIADKQPDPTFKLDGICTVEPEGGAMSPREDRDIPEPFAYFPLTGGDAASWPVPYAQGTPINVDVVDDAAFGKVFQCSEEAGSYIVLDNVPYGDSGSFAVSFWTRSLNNTGNTFQYIYSHAGLNVSDNPWIKNQVQVYLAETNHSSRGILRAIVKDIDDVEDGEESEIYLDSDGDVSITLKDKAEIQKEAAVNATDGQWHMVTVTTRTDGKKGFSIFVDGILSGEMVEDVTYTGADGVIRRATGGDPMRAGGNIYLCGRHDGNPERHYDGLIAHLALYDSGLSSEEVKDIYNGVLELHAALKTMATSGDSGRRRSLLQSPGSASRTQDTFQPLTPPFQPRFSFGAIPTAIPVALPPGSVPRGSWQGAVTGQPGKFYGRCSGDYAQGIGISNAPECQEGLTCIPILTPTFRGDSGGQLERVGVCARFPSDGAYIFDPKSVLTIPIAYFPLTSTDLNSWPLPVFSGRAPKINLIEDEVFGSALDCQKSKQDEVILDNVGYATSGHFTVNLWIRYRRKAIDDDASYEFVFSHTEPGAQASGSGAQIELYMPGPGNPQLLGRIQALVKDSDDSNDGASPGKAGTSDLDASSNGSLLSKENSSSVTDGIWHMITVSSHEAGTHGYRLFVDGVLVGEKKGESNVPGGDPIDIEGKIHLCGRSDGNSDVHFDGSVAHLALYNKALGQQEILALYEEFVLVSNGIQVAHPTRATTTGEPCVFPGISGGKLVVDCVPINGVLSCPVKDGTWVECKAFNRSAEAFAELDKPSVPQGVTRTVTGEVCRFPSKFGGKDVYSCVKIDGIPKCNVGNGQWKRCASKGHIRFTKQGARCVFPFTYEEKIYVDCAVINRVESCMVANGNIYPCAGTSLGSDGASVGPDDVDDVPHPDEAITRTTIDRKACIFPFWHEGKSVAGCVIDGQSRTCPVAGGDMKQCSNLIFTKGGNPCAFPFPDDKGDDQFSCMRINDTSVCRTAAGVYEECVGPLVNGNALPDILLAGRVTVGGDKCTLPFWHGKRLVRDCIVVDSVEKCKVESGELVECAPRRTTTTGDQCSFPFEHNDEQYDDCIKINGTESCITMTGSIEECAPLQVLAVDAGAAVNTKPEAKESVVPRITVDGDSCVFPFWYRGSSIANCIPVDGVDVCPTGNGNLAECEPLVFTKSGEPCAFPFYDEASNSTKKTCVPVDGRDRCRTKKGDWEECSWQGVAEEFEEATKIVPGRVTTSNEPCVFPFWYRGALTTTCAEADGEPHSGFCMTAEGYPKECKPPRFTKSGKECSFPFRHEGVVSYDCIDRNGTEVCVTAQGDFEVCDTPKAPEYHQHKENHEDSAGKIVSRVTEEGESCVFPFWHQGKSVASCANIGGYDSCLNGLGNLVRCTPLMQTDAGQPCAFPFHESGEAHTKCLARGDRKMCKIGTGEWANCTIPLSANDLPTTLLAGRVTVDNQKCAFPFWYRGKLESRCIDGRCPSSSGEWIDCRPEQFTISGRLCSVPFTFGGEQHSECISVDGKPQCMTAEGNLEECSTTSQTETAERATVDETLDLGSQILSRVTVDGEQCVWPFWYKGRSVGQCVQIDGEEKCPTNTTELKQCAPLIPTALGSVCAVPFMDDQGQMRKECVNRGGRRMCKVQDGTWDECIGISGQPTQVDGSAVLAGRVTVDGDACAFPFWHEGVLVTTCVTDSAGNSSGWCRTGSGRKADCAPIQTTVRGSQCSFPFSHDGLASTSKCININGELQCKTALGDFEECADLQIASSASTIISRVTIEGDQCLFPYWYQGRSIADCVSVNGIESCPTRAGMRPCRPLTSTANGGICSFPFPGDDEVMHYSCVTRNDTQSCRTSDGKWAECTQRPVPEGAVHGTTKLMTGRATIDGEQCVFPFFFEEKAVITCAGRSKKMPNGQCITRDGAMKECAPVWMTSQGDYCSFPFTVAGKVHHQCVPLGGKDVCKTADGSFAECKGKVRILSELDGSASGSSSSATIGVAIGSSVAVAIVAVAAIGIVVYARKRSGSRKDTASMGTFKKFQDQQVTSGPGRDIALQGIASSVKLNNKAGRGKNQ
ncbi:unnamed protein product, partial [Ostreobium quekettii]